MTDRSQGRIPGMRGSLLSQDALADVVPARLHGLLDESGRARARRRIRTWHLPLRRQLGPASSPRTIFDALAVPMFSQLGYRVLPDIPASRQSAALRSVLKAGSETVAVLMVAGWSSDAAGHWRDAVHHGIAHGVRWCYALTGPSLRMIDCVRTYSRRFVELNLEVAFDDERAFAVLWGLFRAAAMRRAGTSRQGTLLEQAIAISEDHRAAVRSSLQSGVDEALVRLHSAFSSTAASRRSLARDRFGHAAFDEALIVIYRILFLLFAEARGLVPRWHPIFRDGYTIEALRQPIETLPRPRGLWEAIQSIARLAHRGCRVGALRVTPFNGRLFSPIESPLADSTPLDDGVVRQALLALTTRRTQGGRQRIAYGDLGVEQLGGVYEHVLDLDPGAPGAARNLGRGERRRSTGSFYTPRALTEFLVRRTLAPLVDRASPDAILSLRILDPAMGSGAFLVAACRYLAAAYEQAVRRDEGVDADEIGEQDRAGFRRRVAQRCLFGVDINPMAVQLGRLSLWLATLAADRPLTFLDHRLRTGNSLVGATPADLARQAPGGTRHDRGGRPSSLPLFDDPSSDADIVSALTERNAIAAEPGDTLAQVRAKEHALARLADDDRSLTRWKRACDLWCSYWFVPRPARRSKPVPFGPLADSLFGRGALPPHVCTPVLEAARSAASAEKFFHWPFEFPEVFLAGGLAGFDAVIGNPPWEMLRGDRGGEAARESARDASSRLIDFARGSGIYSLQGGGHANLYQLFLERMTSLVRPRGRLGLILPSGLATDQGAAPLRRHLFERTDIDTFITFENRDAIFPIHRGLKFLILTTTAGGNTDALPCRFGLRQPELLDRLPEGGRDPDAVVVPRTLVERVGGRALAIPDVRCREDVEIISHIAFTAPALGDANGWNVRFGRELNATDDRRHFERLPLPGALPVLEGKQITPFAVDVSRARFGVRRAAACTLLDAARTFDRPRLAYRDVASAANRLTLIAAIVPAGTVTTHTVFCMRTELEDDCARYLCGMFNSFVANYLVRFHVGTHVTTAIVSRLPMPRPATGSAELTEMSSLVTDLITTPGDGAAHARLQAAAARAYGLSCAQFQRVLDTLPLVPIGERDAAMAAFKI